ncbi:MAG: hypothetical protein PHG02_09905 [Oscillospiraceae bacterium]|nr:hypothetical protein [Oscillospiraceae bacterium]
MQEPVLHQKTLHNRVLESGSETFNTQLLYFTTSSLSANDRYLYMICDCKKSPNVVVKDLQTGHHTILTQNKNGVLKSYVYFDKDPQKGLSKASVALDANRNIVYFIQDNTICKVDLLGNITSLAPLPANRITAFTHVSADGNYLCVPMTDARALEYDPETQGEGLDRRPVYNIDKRVQDENLSSYLCVYNTKTGVLEYEKKVPRCWITHVQFHPLNNNIILYNHEWSSFDCGVRRMWLYNHADDTLKQVRTEGKNEDSACGFARTAEDWVCHEMWSDDGAYIIYHGGFANGPAMVGRVEVKTGICTEIALPKDYDAYGHFTINHGGDLVCDGYFKYPWEIKKVWQNSTDNGPDPHKKDAEYICRVTADWEKGILNWQPLCKHESDWLGQDAHPHPIYNHQGSRVFFSSRNSQMVKVYSVAVKE